MSFGEVLDLTAEVSNAEPGVAVFLPPVLLYLVYS